MTYDFKRLENIELFTPQEIEVLENINQSLPLEKFLANPNLVEKFGFDFVYTSAKIEGNTYSKADALTLLDYGKTAGGKSFDDAKMLINLNKAFKYILNDDCEITKYKIRTIHQILADELLEDADIGCVRKKGVLIKGSNYIPITDSLTLESEFDRMLEISKTIQNSFNKALYLHNNIAYLQYFADVNKRTARTILNLSLKCQNKMLLIPSEELIPIYVDGILSYYENGNTLSLRQFFIQSYQNMYAQVKEIL
jgi:Fic family protein